MPCDSTNHDTHRTDPVEPTERARRTALDCVHAGIEAADPARVVRNSLTVQDASLRIASSVSGTTEAIDLTDFDRILVLGGGNAAGRAALALERVLDDRLDGGIVVTDAPQDTAVIEQLPGDHPTPSRRGVDATRDLLATARNADENTLVLVPITGGGSALMPAPADGVDLDALRSVTDALVRSGAPIEEVNAVRKHLSDVKGGRLADALAPARFATLVFSDVVGNPLDVVASGPTVPDPTTFQDALDVLSRHEIPVPEQVDTRLCDGVRGAYPETPAGDDSVFDSSSVHVLADNLTACDAAQTTAAERGFDALVLTTRVTGPAREAARWHTAIAHEIWETGNPIEPPAVVVTGGETTVRVTGEGTGGPNLEFALAAAPDLPRQTVLAAVDTDGVDGNSGVAGAVVTNETVDERDEATSALDSNDSYRYLADREAVVDTGVTGTNVNDLRVLVVAAGDEQE